ncbi:MAG: hypothetical protein KKE23_02930 [Nanoarchaeota archaeon]|nr:hypothetical protein [Nanoarchaeota archaeon]
MTSDIEKTIESWVGTAKKKGFSDEQIRKEMRGKGYMPDMIDNALRESSRNKTIKKYALVFSAIVAAILIVVSIISLTSSTCRTDECFIQKANECQTVNMEKVIAGSIYRFSEKDCILTKTAKTMSATEPSSVVALLQSRSMVCPYNQGNFDDNLITTVLVGTENCSGELKIALDTLKSIS